MSSTLHDNTFILLILTTNEVDYSVEKTHELFQMLRKPLWEYNWLHSWLFWFVLVLVSKTIKLLFMLYQIYFYSWKVGEAGKVDNIILIWWVRKEAQHNQ